MEVLQQVEPLQEQEVPPLELVQEQAQELAQQEQVQGQELQQEVQAQQQEVLLQGQEVLLLLEQVREQVRVLEALLRAQAGVLAVVEEEVLDLALAVGLQQQVGPQGQVELQRGRAQQQAQILAEVAARAKE
jgi:hypothetical protein